MEELVDRLRGVRLDANAGLPLPPGVQVWAAPPCHLQFQKCLVPQELFRSLGVLPGVAVSLQLDNTRHITRAFPTSHHTTRIDLYRSVECYASAAPTPILHTLTQMEKLSWLEVEVACSPVHRCTWLAGRARLAPLLHRRILQGAFLCSGATVHLDDFPEALTWGVRKVFVVRASSAEIGIVSDKTKISIRRVMTELQLERSWSSAGRRLFGADRILKEFTDIIEANSEHLLLSYKSLLPIKQVLLAGPSGCGKTSLVEILSNLKKCALIRIEGQDVYHKEPGQAEQLLSNLFKEAFHYARAGELSIVMIEDVDILCPIGKNVAAHTLRLSTRLMHLLDECQETSGVVVIATTNRPTDINIALRRQGRLAKEIFMGKPSEIERVEIISNFLNMYGKFTEAEYTKISTAVGHITPGYLGADLNFLCQMACYKISSIESAEEKSIKSIKVFREVLLGMKPAALRNEVEIVPGGRAAPPIGGLDEVRKQLELTVYCSLLNPQTYIRLGIQKPRGVLLYGPPGCAKTSLVRTLAAKGNITVLCATSASIYSPYVGDAEKAIVQLFDNARQNTPSIIFFDEIDSLVGSRSHSNNSNNVQERVLAALLTQMDGIGITKDVADYNKCITDGDDVMVVGATNRPKEIDPALLRPGRFDRHIYVPPPDCKSRLDILRIVTKNTPLDDSVDLEEIARRTEYYSGADLKNLHTEAVLHAMKEEGVDVSSIKSGHYNAVLEVIKPSLHSGTDEQFRNIL